MAKLYAFGTIIFNIIVFGQSLLPATATKAKCQGSKSCGAKGFFKDGNCDDHNNNCGCGWDGGDCCGKNGKKYQYSYCRKCRCRDPAKQHLAGRCPVYDILVWTTIQLGFAICKQLRLRTLTHSFTHTPDLLLYCFLRRRQHSPHDH